MTQPSPLVTPPTTTTFVDEGQAISPTWLRAHWSSRVEYSLQVSFDALSDAAGYAIRAGLPSLAPVDALPWLAQDRQLQQGPGETNAAFVSRLQQWMDIWRHAGTSTGLMLALRSAVAPSTPEMACVSSSGAISSWDTYANGLVPFPASASEPDPPAHQAILPNNWLWDSVSQPFYAPWMWWRKWIIIWSIGGSPWPAPSATWATGGSLSLSVVANGTYGQVYVNGGTPSTPGTGFVWGDGTCWGWAGTAAQAQALTNLARQWKSAGCWIPWILVTYEATMFDLLQSFGSSKLPDGTWGYWSKVATDATYGQVYVPARPAANVVSFITGTNDGPPGKVLGAG